MKYLIKVLLPCLVVFFVACNDKSKNYPSHDNDIKRTLLDSIAYLKSLENEKKKELVFFKKFKECSIDILLDTLSEVKKKFLYQNQTSLNNKDVINNIYTTKNMCITSINPYKIGYKGLVRIRYSDNMYLILYHRNEVTPYAKKIFISTYDIKESKVISSLCIKGHEAADFNIKYKVNNKLEFELKKTFLILTPEIDKKTGDKIYTERNEEQFETYFIDKNGTFKLKDSISINPSIINVDIFLDKFKEYPVEVLDSLGDIKSLSLKNKTLLSDMEVLECICTVQNMCIISNTPFKIKWKPVAKVKYNDNTYLLFYEKQEFGIPSTLIVSSYDVKLSRVTSSLHIQKKEDNYSSIEYKIKKGLEFEIKKVFTTRGELGVFKEEQIETYFLDKKNIFRLKE